MLKPRVIAKVLQQALTGGVETALLLTRDGAVLASGTSPGKSDTAIRAAVAASAWKDYEACLRSWSDVGDDPRWLLLRCERGYAIVRPVGELLVALVANETCELGMLRLKVDALVKHFEEPLKKVVL
ncbi:hypothetical protein THASP1DRAFT_29299 [Thamnocephalis sphaerospora]|uniref:Roadblock/LAMTOR2 domain-containing protein n=1 Tax=Thamnocephalis sphaerospora TaxID=78915 RepID=A0A4P9XTN2_9FUNG|nr:hypothetical protein THASP1DRAFT_29299 [Thamnocephalis sphaerospora]|eukprot:RKP08911.1 hypothetical protein THASP1DRAFT_29299 [Thamnocephalis sphaerospora]